VFFAFFGEANSKKNRENFDTYLAHRLDETTRRYWRHTAALRGPRIDMFSKDLYRYSLLGRFLGVLQTVAKLHGKQLNEMLAARSPAEQRATFDRVIAPLTRLDKMTAFLKRYKKVTKTCYFCVFRFFIIKNSFF
jgi:S-adenosylmethionine-diacylglycerol 3-amino-3-carboxypropyl transferase